MGLIEETRSCMGIVPTFGLQNPMAYYNLWGPYDRVSMEVSN